MINHALPDRISFSLLSEILNIQNKNTAIDFLSELTHSGKLPLHACEHGDDDGVFNQNPSNCEPVRVSRLKYSADPQTVMVEDQFGRQNVVTLSMVFALKGDYERFNNTDNSLPNYLNPEHENYAAELDAAIKAHQAIFENGGGNKADSVTGRLRNWIEKNYPNISEKALERIVSVANIKKEIPKPTK